MEASDIDPDSAIAPETRSGLTARLNNFIDTANRIWLGSPDPLSWADVSALVMAALDIDQPDRELRELLERLAVRGVPADVVALAGKAPAAVNDTVRRRFGRVPTATTEKQTEDRGTRQTSEPARDRRPESDLHIVATAADRQPVRRHQVVATIRAPQRQPLSGTTGNVELRPPKERANLRITGFHSVSPPTVIPIVYQVDGEQFAGTATADEAPHAVAVPFTFRVPARVLGRGVDRVRVGLSLSFDRQGYVVLEARHVEIRTAPLPHPRRLANCTLACTEAKKTLPDEGDLALALRIDVDDHTGAIIYFIDWQWNGRMWRRAGKATPLSLNGTIKITPVGSLFALDAATAKHFGLPEVGG